MANPQKENGNTGINNEVLEALINAKLNGTEWMVCMYVIRKTWGYNKREDEISLSQFTENIPATKQAICKAISNLKLVNILLLVSKGKSVNSSNRFKFNKDFETWATSKQTLTSKQKLTSQLVNNCLHTKKKKENIIINNNTKESLKTRNKTKLFLNTVLLTEEEYNRLISDYNTEIIDKAIEILDNYLTSGKGGKYKNHNLVIRKWCIKEAYKQLNLHYSGINSQRAKSILKLFKN